MGMFSVRVVNEDGDPVKSARVSVDFGLLRGQSTEYTDENGWAEFSNLDGDLVTGEFYVNGESQGDHSTHDGDSYSFTI
ncbi:MAG: hypothetical protein Q8O19_05110 [Rectinemataceae bacterium]|nr:hypothetical protein [Rectinemataceae bacterium]